MEMPKHVLLLLKDLMFLTHHWFSGLHVSSWLVQVSLTSFQIKDLGPTLFCLSVMCWYVPNLVSTFAEPAANASVKSVSECLVQ